MEESVINKYRKIQSKFIFITGGVVSSVGKGILASSLGRLFKKYGFVVSILKLDPYLNTDPGTMSPHEHGEVFVTSDGAETDLDLGHYERFLEQKMSSVNSRSAGKIYKELLNDERKGVLAGQTIQVIPHLTSYIQNSIINASKDSEITIVEVGGTVGDIEAQPFLNAVQDLKRSLQPYQTAHIHITWLFNIPPSKLLKTKPTQHSLKELRSTGISPDFLFCRSEFTMDKSLIKKLSKACGLKEETIFSIPNLDSVYNVPGHLEKLNVLQSFAKCLNLKYKIDNINDKWMDEISNRDKLIKNSNNTIKIALIVKYIEVKDSYLSVYEAIINSGYSLGINVIIERINSCILDSSNIQKILSGFDAILVPGGFGYRGVEGKILAAKYARENNIVFLGICLGLQIGLIELARNLLNKPNANSIEFDKDTDYPIITLVRKFQDREGKIVYRSTTEDLGGTLRLGEQECRFVPDTIVSKAYGVNSYLERHRHRYEINGELLKPLEGFGVQISAKSSDNKLIECVELKDHIWWVGCQYHPEFSATIRNGHPLFISFIKAAYKKRFNISI